MISRIRIEATGPSMKDVADELASAAERIGPMLRQPVLDGDYLVERDHLAGEFKGRRVLHPNIK